MNNVYDGPLPFRINSLERESYSSFYPKRWRFLVEIGRERSSLVPYFMFFSEGLSEIFIAENGDEG